MKSKILLTGAAGFIGFHFSNRLLEEGFEVIGIDSLNKYYDVNLKKSRLNILKKNKNFSFVKGNLENRSFVDEIFKEDFDFLVNLAAQAGVRYSLENPDSYIDSNISGFMNILENLRSKDLKHTIFASSSSVYGLNKSNKFSEKDSVDHPISLYAATKRSNELMAHSYSNMFSIPITGIRFFTVYGPWGRPDMALFKFTKSILENKTIDLYNNGNMYRDFTFIDDVIECLFLLLNKEPKGKNSIDTPHQSIAKFRLLNIGNGKPVKLKKFIQIIEKKLNKRALISNLPMQPGDVEYTRADTSELFDLINHQPKIEIEEGVSKFVDWYLKFYKK